MGSTKKQNDRIIFGLRVRQLRQERKLSFTDLKDLSGLSVSYLNEIEKGKKFPKPAKLAQLAKALGVEAADLTAAELSGAMAPVGILLQSNFLHELPLDLFGIELSKVVEIIAGAPTRVGAFISTLVELSKNYSLGEAHFYHGALRSFQEMHANYFEEIESAATDFLRQHQLNGQHPIEEKRLQEILEQSYKYKVVADGLATYESLHSLRSVFVPKRRQLLLNGKLSDIQRTFQLAKELGFNFLQLNERALTSSLIRVESFEQVLNHFKAAYFAVAILIPRDPFVEDLRRFFQQPRWEGEGFIELMKQYRASPEMLFQRLTNVIPRFFGIQQMFFLRFTHNEQTDAVRIDKELQINQPQYLHANRVREHYCRRWQSISLLKDLQRMQQNGQYVGTIVGAQRSRYHRRNEEYLTITLARPAYPTPHQNVSVTIGFRVNEELKKVVRFWDDERIHQREVNTTCERCAIQDCQERVAPPVHLERRQQRRQVEEDVRKLTTS